MVQYSTEDICLSRSSIRIAKRKSWSCTTYKQSKICFCLVAISNFTFIYRTLLLKMTLVKICYTLGETLSFLIKSLRSKYKITILRPSKILLKSIFISYMCVSIYNHVTFFSHFNVLKNVSPNSFPLKPFHSLPNTFRRSLNTSFFVLFS